MEDLFKKFIYAGVGFVSRTNDRVQDTINQLVQENKLSQKEGEKILKSLQKNSDTKRKEFETQINSIAKRVMKGMGVASNSDVEELKRTVKGSGSKASGAAASTGTKKASAPAASATGAAKTAAKATTKAAGAASTAAKKSAAGSKGSAATAKKSDSAESAS
ncbi:phasin family protein [Hymenobacter jeollabukensis]|uniref:Polyhydroxyalkanoate synthesis regulator phasin n=1 Tax=Hymenobacter jeollabukensis TaxID=2025313 RepID=A0A5R8WKP9_9BACT|nr:hypothetical protein [Hymenobacter jeollabukensis]TLM89628.1 hypothetical protein FDY95_19980 [Hymenobacter jeollabukensis]